MEQTFFPCAYCSMKFMNVHECYAHVRLHVEGKIDESSSQNSQDQPNGPNCSVNGNVNSAPKWKRPARKHPPERNFTCEICGKSFATKRYLRQYHMITHLDCKICSQSFVSLEEAAEHRKIHANENVKVGQMKYSPNFKYVSECEPEMEQNTAGTDETQEEPKKLYACNICNRKFADLKYLMKKHLPSHLEPCKMCSQTFANFDEAAEHLKVHPDDTTPRTSKAFKCELCKKSFIKMSNLKKHLCKHSDKKSNS